MLSDADCPTLTVFSHAPPRGHKRSRSPDRHDAPLLTGDDGMSCRARCSSASRCRAAIQCASHAQQQRSHDTRRCAAPRSGLRQGERESERERDNYRDTERFAITHGFRSASLTVACPAFSSLSTATQARTINEAVRSFRARARPRGLFGRTAATHTAVSEHVFAQPGRACLRAWGRAASEDDAHQVNAQGPTDRPRPYDRSAQPER